MVLFQTDLSLVPYTGLSRPFHSTRPFTYCVLNHQNFSFPCADIPFTAKIKQKFVVDINRILPANVFVPSGTDIVIYIPSSCDEPKRREVNRFDDALLLAISVLYYIGFSRGIVQRSTEFLQYGPSLFVCAVCAA